jgi:hypothetical protein
MDERHTAIETLIEQEDLYGQPTDINGIHPHPDVFPPEHNHCYNLRLSKGGMEPHEWLYVYVGKNVLEMSLGEALWILSEMAETYGGWETFDRWNEEHDGFYEYDLGKEVAEGYYLYCRETYTSLVNVLGEELCQRLNTIIRG